MRAMLTKKAIMATALLAAAACEKPAPLAPQSDQPAAATLEGDFSQADPAQAPASPGFWAQSPSSADTLIYGYSQSPPLLSVACKPSGTLTITRFATAPSDGKVLAAWLGNRDAVRFAMDASWNGRGWLWVGMVPADAALVRLVSGDTPMSLTLPGIGQIEMESSLKVQALAKSCAPNQQAHSS